MKFKLLSLLLVLSVAACGGNSETADNAAENVNAITTEQVVENNVSAQAEDRPRQFENAGDGGVRNGAGFLVRFDLNEDGVLQAEEVPETFDFATLDVNEDGVLDESEMLAVASGPPQGEGPPRGEGGLLARFDADQDGLISEAEAPAEWAFGEYDVNGDSFIDAEEMTQIRPGGNRATGN